MKKLLFILFLLPTIAFSINGWFPYDTLIIGTVNYTGTSEFKLYNATKDSVPGILTNVGNGAGVWKRIRLIQTSDTTANLLLGTTSLGTVLFHTGSGGGGGATYTLTLNSSRDSFILTGSNSTRYAVRDSFVNTTENWFTGFKVVNTSRDFDATDKGKLLYLNPDSTIILTTPVGQFLTSGDKIGIFGGHSGSGFKTEVGGSLVQWITSNNGQPEIVLLNANNSGGQTTFGVVSGGYLLDATDSKYKTFFRYLFDRTNKPIFSANGYNGLSDVNDSTVQLGGRLVLPITILSVGDSCGQSFLNDSANAHYWVNTGAILNNKTAFFDIERKPDTAIAEIGVSNLTTSANKKSIEFYTQGTTTEMRINGIPTDASVIKVLGKKADSSTAWIDVSGFGSGTVTSVATNTATGITGGTITGSGTLAIDTTLIATKGFVIGRGLATGTVTSIATTDSTGINGGTITSTGTLSLDTTRVVASKKWVDSRLATKGNGTVTSVATGNGLSGGTITTTGTLSVDTSVIASKTYTDAKSINDNYWVYINSTNASSSASVDFTGLSSAYKAYKLMWYRVLPASGSVETWLRIGTAGGIQSGGTDYIYYRTAPVGSTSTATDSKIQLLGAATPNTTNNEGYGELTIWNPSQTTEYHAITGLYYIDSPGSGFLWNIFAKYRSSTAVTQVSFLFSSGNIASGTFILYGLR